MVDRVDDFECSSLTARATGLGTGRGTSIAVDFGPTPKGFQDLEASARVDGSDTLRQAFGELFGFRVEFMVDEIVWARKKRRVAVARHNEEGRQAMVYVDIASGDILGLRLRGYGSPQHVAAM